MKKLLIYISLVMVLMFVFISCIQKTEKKEIVGSQARQSSEEIYQSQLAIPPAVPTAEEIEYGVLYDNELEGGWQLMGSDNEFIPFGSSKAFIFIQFYKNIPNKDEREKYPKYYANTCFVVLYYWNPTVQRWIAEYNGGQQIGNTIHVAPLEGEFSKGEPYDIVHIIDTDGRRYVEIRNHKVLRLEGRRFYKTLP